MSDTTLVDALAALAIAVSKIGAPQRPLWTLADIADQFQLHAATVRTQITCRADFPTAIPLTDTARGELRWRREEVMEWADGRQLPTARSKRTKKGSALAIA